MKNTKGLSTIVTTLILVLLALVAVGILWNPVKNLLNENTEAFDKTKCLTVDLKTDVRETTGIYTVKLSRRDGGDESVYAKLVIHNDTQNSGILDFNIPIGALETVTESPYDLSGNAETDVTAANLIEVTPYFRDIETNKEQLCTTVQVELG